MLHGLLPLVLEISMSFSPADVSTAPVKHPNLLLDRGEIEGVKAKIAKYPWAAAALEKTKEHALDGPPHENGFIDQALYYAFTGDRGFADRARGHLLECARSELPEFQKLDVAKNPEFGSWNVWGARAWAYDLVHETCSDAERIRIEEWFRVSCRVLIDVNRHWTTTPNLMFGKHVNIGLVGYCLGDREIIDGVLNDPGAFGPQRGGFYPVMDTMIKDGRFWAEAPIYALVYDVTNMLALAEAARHFDGTDLYGYVSKKSGASIKSIIDGLPSGCLMDYTFYRELIPDGVFFPDVLPDEVIAGATNASFCYESSVLVGTYRFHAGRFLINSLLIRGNLGKHPAADRLLRNMLRWASEGATEPPAPLPAEFEEHLEAIGYR